MGDRRRTTESSVGPPLQAFAIRHLLTMSGGFFWNENNANGYNLEQDAYFAWGFGGRYVYVVPRLDLVVVATTEWRGLSSEGGPDPLQHAVLGSSSTRSCRRYDGGQGIYPT